MTSVDTENPVSNLQKWRERLQKELKSPLSLEDLQWEVSEYFSLDPVFEASSLGTDYQYLTNFNQEWALLKPNWKPNFKISNLALEKADPEQVSEAEKTGFSAWSGKKFNPEIYPILPVEYRLYDSEEAVGNSNCNFDPIMDSLQLGFWTPTFQKLHSNQPDLPFHIHAADVHNSGGSAVQELAFCLLVTEQYRKTLSEPDFIKQVPDWALHLAAGPSFWLEIAKIRAMRLIWMNFCSINGAGSIAGNIEVETSGVFWSHKDPDGNLLRHTSEVMSGLLAGADAILIHPHTLDKALALEASRLAINIGHLSVKEAHLERYFDPTNGSYLVEILTHKLAEAAWKQFSEWNEIPFISFIENGEFQNQVTINRNKLVEKFRSEDLIMVGVNKHSSPMSRTSPLFPSDSKSPKLKFPSLEKLFLDA